MKILTLRFQTPIGEFVKKFKPMHEYEMEAIIEKWKNAISGKFESFSYENEYGEHILSKGLLQQSVLHIHIK